MYKLYAENADLTSILLGENGDIKFFHTLQNLLKERCLQDWGEIIRMRHIENFEAYFNFLVGGCISLLQHWFASGMKETPAELAEITVRFLGFDI